MNHTRMGLVRGIVVVSLLPLAGCLVELPEHASGGPLQLEVVPDGPDPRADGVSRSMVVIRADEAAEAFRLEVQISTSSGTLGAEGGQSYSGRIPAGGELVVPLTHGRVPGPVLVSATADGFGAFDDTLELAPRGADRVELALEPSTLGAFDQGDLRVELRVDDGGQPSWGSAVALTACCNVGGDPTTCPAPPVSVPASARLEENAGPIRLTVRPLPLEPDDEGLVEPADGFIVARSTSDPVTCTDQAATVIPVRVVP